MAALDIYCIPSVQSKGNNLNEDQLDISYVPPSSTQIPPRPSYSTSAPPPPPFSSYPTSASVPPVFYASLPPSSNAMIQSMQPNIYAPPIVLITQGQTPYQGILVHGNFIPSQTAHIRDYMAWSIVNVFLGSFVLGILAVIFSMLTRKHKQEGDVESARVMSKVTFAVNLIITIIFFLLTAFLVIYFAVFGSILTVV